MTINHDWSQQQVIGPGFSTNIEISGKGGPTLLYANIWALDTIMWKQPSSHYARSFRHGDNSLSVPSPPAPLPMPPHRCLSLTARTGGSTLRSMGFITINTCWFLCTSPVSSLMAALQKNWTQPCLPRKVDGRPSGRPSLKGKLWMPAERSTGAWPGNGGQPRSTQVRSNQE